MSRFSVVEGKKTRGLEDKASVLVSLNYHPAEHENPLFYTRQAENSTPPDESSGQRNPTVQESSAMLYFVSIQY